MKKLIKATIGTDMETFKTVLFGISGLSLIFWVAVIGMWHVDMFPRIFKNDLKGVRMASAGNLSEGSNGSLMGNYTEGMGLFNRNKYSRKSFVVADFSGLESGYGVNRLYTAILLSMAVMTFIIITYGLHSAFTSMGMPS